MTNSMLMRSTCALGVLSALVALALVAGVARGAQVSTLEIDIEMPEEVLSRG